MHRRNTLVLHVNLEPFSRRFDSQLGVRSEVKKHELS